MMNNTIDMQLMRYINLFERISKISTTNCFIYNNIIIFAVPKKLVFKAVGKNGANMRELGEILGKKIKIIEERDEKEADKFVADIVSPVEFTRFEIRNNQAVLTAGRMSKASLIGRNRTREQELEDILKKFYNVTELKII